MLKMIEAGGNVYYLAKLAGIFGLNVQDIGAQQTGMTVEEFKAKLRRREVDMARIIGGIGTTHVPSIGKAIAEGKQNDRTGAVLRGLRLLCTNGCARASPTWSWCSTTTTD